MQRHDCIEILKQLKLTAMVESFDEVVIEHKYKVGEAAMNNIIDQAHMDALKKAG